MISWIVYLKHLDLFLTVFVSGESTKAKAEKVETVAPQGNYQKRMLIHF